MKFESHLNLKVTAVFVCTTIEFGIGDKIVHFELV